LFNFIFPKVLISLLASFPDYDFSSITSESFVQEDSKSAIHRVNSYLAEITTDNPEFLESLWRTADDAMHLSKCEVFSYLPDLDEENPFNEGTLWSFNYFFFNKELKRICYFNCNAKRYFKLIVLYSYLPRYKSEDTIVYI